VSGLDRIRRAEPADSLAIAGLHLRQIPWGLLAQLGVAFVATFYQALLASPQGFAFVAERDGRIVGFASGVLDWRGFYREFLRRHLTLAVRGFLAGFRRGRWRRLLETSRYAASGTLPPAELISIALEPEARGSGISGELVRHVLTEFAARHVLAVRVTAGGEAYRHRPGTGGARQRDLRGTGAPRADGVRGAARPGRAGDRRRGEHAGQPALRTHGVPPALVHGDPPRGAGRGLRDRAPARGGTARRPILTVHPAEAAHARHL